jgi:hypothetical protein
MNFAIKGLRRTWFCIIKLAIMCASTPPKASFISFPSKPRVFILTDITNEPDDAESFCRYLTYSNQFDTEGVVATTSTWLRNKVAPENLQEIIDAYQDVVQNLNAHVHPDFPYPSAQHVRSVVRSGPPVSERTCHRRFRGLTYTFL